MGGARLERVEGFIRKDKGRKSEKKKVDERRGKTL